jgi:hypothetical protein
MLNSCKCLHGLQVLSRRNIVSTASINQINSILSCSDKVPWIELSSADYVCDEIN